jgi:S-ribosylhomocysteine lyase
MRQAHTFEHLFATHARNTKWSDGIIYIGPMGCLTGFYFLARDSISHDDAISLVRKSFEFIKNFEGDIPGVGKQECGNYLLHDLEGAKAVADDMLKVLENWDERKLKYV